MSTPSLSFTLLLSGCLLSVVCGGGLVSVSGTVYLDDKPLADANVAFTEVVRSRTGTGVTDESGRFALATREPGDGVYPGQYKVTVVKTLVPPDGVEVDPLPPKEVGGAPIMPTGFELEAARMLKAREKWNIPEAYWYPHKTPITIEITDAGNDNVEIRLKSDYAASQ